MGLPNIIIILLLGGATVCTVVFLVAMWRWMRAHEKVAQNLDNLVEVLGDEDDNDH